jgi:ABC-type Mn2+/Zn2+ transport system ATPase subunit
MKYCIEISNLSIAYSNQLALENVSIRIPKGQIVGVIGPNGSGKTSLLKGMLELIPIQSGEILFFGKSLNSSRSKIAYVPQRESVDWNFPISVREIVEMGRFNPKKWWRKYDRTDEDIVQLSLEMVGLSDFHDRHIQALSGGQQQRVFLARALAQKADLIVLDEPFSGIDAPSQDAILQVLLELKSAGKSILMVHHDLSAVSRLFDSVILLKNKLVADGPVHDVLNKQLLSEAFGTDFFQSWEQ